MPKPPIVAAGGQASDDQQIAGLAHQAAVNNLLIRAAAEVDALIDNFAIEDTDTLLATKVREWIVRKEQLRRLEAMMQEAAQSAAQEKTSGNSRPTY